jgi:tetratricopeptide (TPR) repeat protein
MEPYDLTLLQRFLLAGRDIWFYLSKLVWPNNLTFTYPRWTIDPAQWDQWIFSIAAIGVTIGLWAIRKQWRGPLAAWLFFCGTLFPVLGFVNVFMFKYTYVADHLQYLASLGIIVLASAAIALGLERLRPPAWWASVALCACYVGTLAGLSRQQSAMYSDDITLYRETIARNPECWMAHNNYGVKLADAGHQAEAIAHYQTAIELKPNYFEAHNNLGDALTRIGRLPEAIKEFQAALALKPDFFQALNNLGLALTNSGRYEEAIQSLQTALRLAPDHPIALNNMGLALIHLGRFQEAIEHINHALQVKPDFADAQNSLGIALASSGRMAMAIEHFLIAIRLKNDFLEAYNNLARALAAENRRDEAIETTRKAINVARSIGNEAAAKRIEESLYEFQKKRRQTPEASSLEPR